MKLSVVAKVESDILTELPGKLTKKLHTIIKKSCFDVQADAASTAPIDTGATRAAIHVVMTDVNGYSAASAIATSLNPKAEVADEEVVTDELTGKTVSPLHYNPFLEFGTENRAARPYLGPALDRNAPAYLAACKSAVMEAANGD